MSNIDGVSFLSNLLLGKPFVLQQEIRSVERQVCHPKRGGREGNDPWCDVTTDQIILNSNEAAKCVSSYITEVRDLAFSDEKRVSLPESAIITRKEIRNNADASVNSSLNLSVAGTSSWSVVKTNGLSTTNSAGITMSYSAFGVGSGGINIGWSQTISSSTSVTDGGSKTISRSGVDSISIGPHRGIRVQLLAYQSAIEIPFTAIIVIDGDIASNKSGINLASQLLTEQERSVPFSGILRISDVSEAFLNIDDLPPEVKGGLANEGLESSTTSFTYPITVNSEIPSMFIRHSNIQRSTNNLLLSHNLATGIEDDGPSIGVPDGETYQILYTQRVLKPSPACGFNDIGIMNGAIFIVEARQYSTYLGGKLLRQWEEHVETFDSCWIA